MLRELVIELTGDCPLQCLHCSSSGMQGHALPHETAWSLAEQALSLGVRQVSFGGGEPTLSPLLAPLARYLSRGGARCDIYTCGARKGGRVALPLPMGVIEDLALGGAKMTFSIHGGEAETHDGVTGSRGSFASMMASALACSNAGITTAGNFVPLRQNKSEIGDVLELADCLGMSQVSILRFVPQGRGARNQAEIAIPPGEERDFAEELSRLRESSPVPVRTGSPYNGIIPGNAVPCRAGTAKMVVQPDGNVIPCEVFKHDQRRGWGASACRDRLEDILGMPAMRAAAAAGRCPVHCDGSKSVAHDEIKK